LTDDDDVGAVLLQAALEAAGATVGMEAGDAGEAEDVAGGLADVDALTVSQELADVGGEVGSATPLVIADVLDDLAFGDGGDHVVHQDGDAGLVGGADAGDHGVSVDRVDGEGIDALLDELFDDGDLSLEVGFTLRGLGDDLPAEGARLLDRAVLHGDVERTDQRRRYDRYSRRVILRGDSAAKRQSQHNQGKNEETSCCHSCALLSHLLA